MPDRGQVVRADRLDHLARAREDLHRVVLHPARARLICSCSRWSAETIRPSRSNTMKRVLVVPWSSARCSRPCSET
jgi:hypothetical protein